MVEVHVTSPDAHHRSKRFLIAFVAFAAGLGFALVPAPQVNAVAVAPPAIEASVGFVVGSVVDQDWEPGIPWGAGYALGYLDAAVDDLEEGTAKGWSVEKEIAGGPPTVIASGTTSSASLTLPIPSTDYEDDFGGGSLQVTNWTVKASNDGGKASYSVPAGMDITQEDGTNARGTAAVGTVTTKGKWRTASCNCYLAGTTQRNAKLKNWMEFTTTVVDGQRIAVVMPMFPKAGVARFKLDGVMQADVDTYAATRRNRVIMWETPVLAAGTHTIRIVNMATTGRPRIDVDAFLITTP
jgi:hypothetical protein